MNGILLALNFKIPLSHKNEKSKMLKVCRNEVVHEDDLSKSLSGADTSIF